MTTVERFGNFRLAIFRDHNPPHFHILGPECSLAIDLRNFTIIDGRHLPNEALPIIDWAKENAELLWRIWRELNG